MKKLHFQYEMRLRLDSNAWDHHFRFQCLPIRDGVQEDLGTACVVTPCGVLSEVTDGFGNRSCWGEAMEAHRELTVDCRGYVKVDLSGRERCLPHPLYRVPSAFTGPEANIQSLYEQSVREYVQSGGDPDALDILLVQRFMTCLREHFTYEAGVTDVRTTASQALELGRGVCQDYAHILVSLCRLAGIPARYTAGAMIGEGATHAWVEVWDKGRWIGVDPTHGRLADEGYIRFSVGRDFADCTVDRGCFKGLAAQQQNIFVKVEETS